MSRIATTRFSAFALAAVMTLTILLGVDSLARHEPAGASIAVAAAAQPA